MQLKSVPGVQGAKILSVDGNKYTEKLGQKDYALARSKGAEQFSKKRGTARAAVVNRFEEAELRDHLIVDEQAIGMVLMSCFPESLRDYHEFL